jgi:hypothetical protein
MRSSGDHVADRRHRWGSGKLIKTETRLADLVGCVGASGGVSELFGFTMLPAGIQGPPAFPGAARPPLCGRNVCRTGGRLDFGEQAA